MGFTQGFVLAAAAESRGPELWRFMPAAPWLLAGSGGGSVALGGIVSDGFNDFPCNFFGVAWKNDDPI